jgi:S-adenosylmethionine/arginine decarboxylase-like enzyme
VNHTFHQLCVELEGIPGATLGDQAGLSGVTIAAAGAIGLSPYGAPIARSGPQGTIVALLCHGGHVVLHALPEQNMCLVDIVARGPVPIERGIDVIALRLGATARHYGR